MTGARQPEPTVALTTEASPALAEPMPGGFRPVEAAEGTGDQPWGDSFGSSLEPFVVLAPESEAPTVAGEPAYFTPSVGADGARLRCL